MNIVQTNYSISSEKIKNNKKFVIISNLKHNFTNPNFAQITDAINQIDADTIFIVGNIMNGIEWNDYQSLKSFRNLLMQFKQSTPVVMVPGSLDMKPMSFVAAKNYDDLRTIRKGIYPLLSESKSFMVNDDLLNTTGMLGISKHVKRIKDEFDYCSDVNPSAFNILINHSADQLSNPSLTDDFTSYDLMLTYSDNGRIPLSKTINCDKYLDCDWRYLVNESLKHNFKRGLIYGNRDERVLFYNGSAFIESTQKYMKIDSQSALEFARIKGYKPVVISNGINGVGRRDTSEITVLNLVRK